MNVEELVKTIVERSRSISSIRTIRTYDSGGVTESWKVGGNSYSRSVSNYGDAAETLDYEGRRYSRMVPGRWMPSDGNFWTGFRAANEGGLYSPSYQFDFSWPRDLSLLGEELLDSNKVWHLQGTVNAMDEGERESWVIEMWVDENFAIHKMEVLLQEDGRAIERTVTQYSAFNEFSDLPIDLPDP